MKRYCLALDLKDDAALIAAYDDHHQQVWPSIIESLRAVGIVQLEIYRTGNRLFMIMETTTDFTFEKKRIADEKNEEVRRWEELMWKYQQAIPGSVPGEKWKLMDKIFELR